MPTKVVPVAQQIEELNAYLRLLRGDYRRATRDLDASWSKRRRIPLRDHLRFKRHEDARLMVELGEKCLEDLRHAQAIQLAPFKPGDHIVARLTVKGFPETETRYAIIRTKWDKRSGQQYDVVRVTKKGEIHGSWRTEWLWADDRHFIILCDLPLTEEAVRQLEHWRDTSNGFLKSVLDDGSLDPYKIETYPYGGKYVERDYWRKLQA